MFYAPNGELWLRNAMRFEVLLDSATGGSGAVWRCEVTASELPGPQITMWPADIIYICQNGRGVLETDTGERCVLGSGACVRLKANSRCFMRNELRDVWRFTAILTGETGAESFLDALGMTNDEDELKRQAEAVGVELFLPAKQAELPSAIKALENRISIPQGMSFNL